MAHRSYAASTWKMSHKQCIVAEEHHLECLRIKKTDNNSICPDTYSAYISGCPADVRAKKDILHLEYKLSHINQ